MEIGSVIELDNWHKYGVAKEERAFWLPFMKDNSHYCTAFYQSGRNAIEALLCFLYQNGSIKKLLLPDYMCETVKDAVTRAGVPWECYGIDRAYDFSIEEINSKLSDETGIFIAHFFGKKMPEQALNEIVNWKKKGVLVIEDITLSLFSCDEDLGVGFGTYTLGSLRKWLPVPDGGFVCSESCGVPQAPICSCVSKYTDFYFAVQAMKRDYVQGQYTDSILKKKYMEIYAMSIKELFSDYRLYPLSDWTRNYLQNYDIDEIIRKREENYDYLYEKLSDIHWITCKIERQKGYLPLGMVIQVEDRDELLSYLIENGIYCNVHWRLEESENQPELTFLTRHSMTIPCDQRYGKAEMNYIVDVLKRWKDK